MIATSATLGTEIIDVSEPQRSYGKTIGTHLGQPIYESIEQNRQRYVFDRIAVCDNDGCPLDQLEQNELLFRPGLIYRRT